MHEKRAIESFISWSARADQEHASQPFTCDEHDMQVLADIYGDEDVCFAVDNSAESFLGADRPTRDSALSVSARLVYA